MGVCGIVESLFCYLFLLFGFLFHITALRKITKEKEKSFFLVEEKRACSHKQDKHRHRDKHRTEAEKERGGKAGRQSKANY